MAKSKRTRSKDTQTAIEDPYGKLADLLSPTEFTTSADVIGAFERTFPEDWKALVERFGHRDDAPDKQRGRHYAASTYLADRLAGMVRMGYVELKHVTEGYDQDVWKHNRRMGTWRLIQRPERKAGDWKFLTVRLPGDTYEKLAAEAAQTKVSVASLAASRGALVCTRHLAKFLRELEHLAVAVSEAKRVGGTGSSNLSEVIMAAQNGVEDARTEMHACRDCWTRYEEFKATSGVVGGRTAAGASR